MLTKKQERIVRYYLANDVPCDMVPVPHQKLLEQYLSERKAVVDSVIKSTGRAYTKKQMIQAFKEAGLQ